MFQSSKTIQYLQVDSGKWTKRDAEIIVETPVSLTVNGEVWLSFMCTPTDLEAMAIGFLYNEGVIDHTEEIVAVRVCPTGDNIDVWLTHSAEKPGSWRRTSGCTGGVTSVITENINSTETHRNGTLVAPKTIQDLMAELLTAQDLYRKTGGVHTSAICDDKRIVLTAEDIGRHNTLDKLAGRILLDEIALDHRILLTTGRISSEMLQKSARIDAAIVALRTSPSSMSIQLARHMGITLIGYVRRTGFRVYTHDQRVLRADQIETQDEREYVAETDR